MATVTGGLIGSCGMDNLIAGTTPPAVAKIFDLRSSQVGVIQRGTVLARDTNGKYYVLGATEKVEGVDTAITGTASAIVADTTGAEDVVVVAYVSGCFYRNLLTVAEGYTLTEADENNLRQAGILLVDGI